MYINIDKPHILSKVHQFNSPRDRHYPMTVSYCEGGGIIGDIKSKLTGFIWKISVASNNDVVIEREDGQHSEVLFNRAGIEQIDFCFDQLMRPFVTYVINNQAYYYHFSAATSSYDEVRLDSNVKFPRVFLDYTNTDDIPKSDVILAYTYDGKLCYRLQRERFTVEHVITTNPVKSMVWRVGRTKDNRVGYLWR